MRLVAYLFKDLFEFIFGSFLPSSKHPQPINPVGPIESAPAKKSAEDVLSERQKALAHLDQCLRSEYRVQYPVRGVGDGD
jgi:hypothetical protein